MADDAQVSEFGRWVFLHHEPICDQVEQPSNGIVGVCHGANLHVRRCQPRQRRRLAAKASCVLCG